MKHLCQQTCPQHDWGLAQKSMKIVPSQSPSTKGRRQVGGFTLLEIMVTATLFIIMFLQIGGMWASLNSWVTDLIERANVDREARIAREFLMNDLVFTENVAIGPSSGWILFMSGVDSSVARYWEEQNMLLRMGESQIQTFPIAKYLANSDFRVLPNEDASTELTFQKGATQVMLYVFMNKIEQGGGGEQGGRWRRRAIRNLWKTKK